MITRHFYERDSVGEALLIAAGTWRDPLRKQKLLFWAYELVLSEEWEYLWEILEKVAIRWGNQKCVDACMPLAHTAEAVLNFLHLLLELPTPAPYDAPTITALTKPLPPGLPKKPATWTAEQRSRLWWAVQEAVARRWSLRLLRLLGSIPNASEYLGLQPTKRGIYHLLEMVGCPANPILVTTSCNISWPAIPVGRVTARLFSVPRAHAPAGPILPLATKEGCAFWIRTWGAVGSVEEEEAVWATCFVDDLPDEWSAAEQAKSHVVIVPSK